METVKKTSCMAEFVNLEIARGRRNADRLKRNGYDREASIFRRNVAILSRLRIDFLRQKPSSPRRAH